MPSELVGRIWSRIAARLRDGGVLITFEHFTAAAEEEFAALTGLPVDGWTRQQLCRMVAAVNSRHPETYVTRGVQNGVDRAFACAAEHLAWTEARVQARGLRSIQRFTRRDPVRDLLEEVDVRPDQLDLVGCVQRSAARLRLLSAGPGSVTPSAGSGAAGAGDSRPAGITRGPELLPRATVQDELPPAAADAVRAGEVTADEAAQRTRQQENRRAALSEREMAKAEERLHVYVSQGALSEKEAEQYRSLRRVDERVQSGEIDAAEASRVRNSILQGGAREELERKVRSAVDQAVRYLQVFESLQKIMPRSHRALEFLVRHKEAVVSGKAADRTAVVEELTSDPVLLDELMDLVARSDHEIRMISVRLPPYNYVARRSGLERIGNLTVEPSFLGELRRLKSEEVSERLHSPDAEVRIRPAADMRCLICLVDHATKRTPFRREVRMVRLARSVEEFFRNTPDVNQARHQAEGFVRTRLRRLFPDMGTEEAEELRQQGAQIIDAVEHRVLAERQAAVEEQRRAAEAAAQEAREAAPKEDADADLEISDDERKRGVMIARVEVRVAGAFRRVPCKVMPDPDEPDRYVIATRDPDTGDLTPQVRRNARRYVSRDREGIWRLG
ncbi:MAG: hypothetical protein AB1505_32085 [Candidatus Latescibacterota bacterium]